ncbi:hypothetical protein HYT58_02545 [Candidatus Woesearchaeota archaeon]|nr:hypothetical protein [Candidatus Woesearchaeota archaeon]
MKCPTCNKGKMERVIDKIKKDNINFEAFKCNSCGEEIMDMKQLKVLSNKYRKLRESREITFSRWGNSIAVRIPGEIIKEYNITSGIHGLLTTDKEGIKIIPHVKK